MGKSKSTKKAANNAAGQKKSTEKAANKPAGGPVGDPLTSCGFYKCKEAREIRDAAIKANGGKYPKINIAAGAARGHPANSEYGKTGSWSWSLPPYKETWDNKINLDPSTFFPGEGGESLKMSDPCVIAQAELFEMANLAQTDKFAALDQHAREGKIGREQFAKAKESLEYHGTLIKFLRAFEACKKITGCHECIIKGLGGRNFKEDSQKLQEHTERYKKTWDGLRQEGREMGYP